jgi:hypothetical protein
MGFDTQKRLAKGHKTGNVEDIIWSELVKLHTIKIKKPTKEFVSRKREAAEKESEKHHPGSRSRAWGSARWWGRQWNPCQK